MTLLVLKLTIFELSNLLSKNNKGLFPNGLKLVFPLLKFDE